MKYNEETAIGKRFKTEYSDFIVKHARIKVRPEKTHADGSFSPEQKELWVSGDTNGTGWERVFDNSQGELLDAG